ncbi:LysE family translocator [Inhella sp.]|uniref:LysE family translocator n=1 Tax=Inhella sp. TaxID=1921806 RepID=UPI0035B21C0C
MEPNSLWIYALLVAGIIALPGMDMAFVAASGLAGGARQGAAALAGIVAGGAVHMAVGLLGLGLLLQASPWLFNAVLLGGALYMAWLGWPLLRHGPALVAEGAGGPAESVWRTALRGLLTCLLNPKAYVFCVTVLPAYLTREPLRALALAGITASAQLLLYGLVLWAALRGRQRFAASPWLARAVGLLLLTTALLALGQGWRSLT